MVAKSQGLQQLAAPCTAQRAWTTVPSRAFCPGTLHAEPGDLYLSLPPGEPIIPRTESAGVPLDTNAVAEFPIVGGLCLRSRLRVNMRTSA